MNEEVEKLLAAGKISKDAAATLNALTPGTYCLHPSWGPGKVESWDLAGQKITINFVNKSAHELGVKFALKSLVPLEEDHILAELVKDPESIRGLAKTDPVAFVGSVLRSHGMQMSIDELERSVKGRFVDEADYKKWWESTKRKLREHREFVVPSRRSEAVILRVSDLSPSEHLLEDFDLARELREKAKALMEIRKHLNDFSDPAAELAVAVGEAGEIAARGARMQPAGALELLHARDHLAEGIEGMDLPEGAMTMEQLIREIGSLADVLRVLPAAVMRHVIKHLPESFGDNWVESVLALIPEAGPRGTAELAALFVDKNEEKALDNWIRAGISQRSLSIDVLVWLCRERKKRTGHLFNADLAPAVFNALEREHMDEESGRSNRLRELLVNDADLIPAFLEVSSPNQVRSIARRLIATPVFDDLSRRSLLARIVKNKPEVHELILGGVEQEKSNDGLVVSWESLKRRREELEDIVERQIPENSNEISVAREMGDLRENFEFKAAKQQQAVLMRRKSELERDLERARGTDFRNADADRISIGSVVTVEPVDGGGQETFTLLGAWDSDPDNHILSYLSATGQTLLGLKVGDEAELPSDEHGVNRKVRVTAIRNYVS